MRLLLASKSPRRRQLLSELGLPVDIVNIDVDEHVDPTLPAARVAEHLACRKADAYPTEQLEEGQVLVTADTVVVLDNRVLGKPADSDEAKRMLQGLRGRSHQVYTGVCLRTRHRAIAFTEETTVHFNPLTDDEIDHYIEHYKPFDKAGAYGIQEWIGMVGVSGIEGCFYNVMGLPVAQLYNKLKEL